MELDYEWDYLGNQIAWLDDRWDDEANQPLGQSFYERGIGGITNGNTEGASATALRPSALYLATNIPTSGVEAGWEGAGWTEVRYGPSGNVSSFTVHGACEDGETTECADITDDVEARIDSLHENCVCAQAQHYAFWYDELNRLIDGSRWDWNGTTWAGAARMRYRYDSANQRTVKQVLGGEDMDESQRIALYVYPGDYERRGVVRGETSYDAVTTGEDATETQYLVAGARIVWDAEVSTGTFVVDRNRRATISAGDLLGTTAASLDLETGELLEVSTYYPNGARENLWAHEDEGIPLEPSGFTGKEADEEIGVVYFGHRWLIPRLGRWSTPDPLHIHAAGGGEALNSYHYVSGNLLQAVDPLGLDWSSWQFSHLDRDGVTVNFRTDSDTGNMQFRREEPQQGPAELSDAQFGAAIRDLPRSEQRVLWNHRTRSRTQQEQDLRAMGEGASLQPTWEGLGRGIGGGIIAGLCATTGVGCVLAVGGTQVENENDALQVGTEAAVVFATDGALRSDPATRRLRSATRRAAAGPPRVAPPGDTASTGSETLDDALRTPVGELAQAAQGEVRGFLSDPRTVWGRSADEIAATFNQAGYSTTVRGSVRGSRRATIVEIQGHPEIESPDGAVGHDCHASLGHSPPSLSMARSMRG